MFHLLTFKISAVASANFVQMLLITQFHVSFFLLYLVVKRVGLNGRSIVSVKPDLSDLSSFLGVLKLGEGEWGREAPSWRRPKR